MGKTSRWIGQKYVCRKTRMQPKSKVELLRDQQDFNDPPTINNDERHLIHAYKRRQQTRRSRHQTPVDEFDGDEDSIHDTRIASEIQRCETIVNQLIPIEQGILSYLRLHSPSLYLGWLSQRIVDFIYWQNKVSVSQ